MKFQWLKDYKEIKQDIAYLEDNLSRSKKELTRWVEGDLAKYKLTSESDGAKLEERIEVIENELAHKYNDLKSIETLVASFEGLEHKILIAKYIENLTLEQTAEKLNYSHNYIKHKHAEIMRILRYVEKVSL